MVTKLTRRRRVHHHTVVVAKHPHVHPGHTLAETVILLAVLALFCCVMCLYYVKRSSDEVTYQVVPADGRDSDSDSGSSSDSDEGETVIITDGNDTVIITN